MPYLGSKSHPLFGYSAGDSSDNLRGTVFSAMPEHGHAYSMGIRAGYYDSGDPGTAVLALYGTSGGNPSSRKSYTSTISLNTRMQDASDGQDYTADLNEAVALSSGTKYGLAALFRGGRMAHGQNSVADAMYTRSTGASTPPDPMGYTGSNTETQMSIWVNYQANSAPNVPSSASPADSASFTTTTPTYAADFRDVDETLPNGLSSDYLNAYQIQVRSVASDGASTGTIVWDSGTVGASSTEQTNRRFSMVHGGAALSPGQRYQWRSRVQDRFGAWGNYSSWTAGDFLVSGAANVTLDGTPTGRTTDTTPDFQGRYNHFSGTSSSHVQVRLYVGSTLIATSAEIAKVVASSALPGTLFTITAAESGFGTLASGVQFSYQERAKASGVWSDWSAKRTFFTNGKPATPTNLIPASGSVVSSLPLLTFQATDPDGDALTPTLRIKDANSAVYSTRTPTYDATLYKGAGGYKHQTVLGNNEIGRLTVTGSPTGGSFTVIRASAVSGAIPWNASAATLQPILEAMSSNGAGNVLCTGGPFPGTPIDIEYRGSLSCTNIAGMGLNTNSLTGGSSPTVSPSTVLHGVNGDFPGYADMKWDVRTTDGDLTSDYSQESLVTYAQGPTVTVTSPTQDEVITTNTPTITWTTVDQVNKRVRVYRSDDNTLVHDSGTIVDILGTYTVPGMILQNNTDYYATVKVTDLTTLTGTSAARRFTLTYTPPDTIASFLASPDVAALDVYPSVIRLTWEPATTSAATFLVYRIWRRILGQRFRDAVWLADLSSIDQNTWVDTNAPPSIDLLYDIAQIVQMPSLDILTSTRAQQVVRLDLNGSVLSDVRDGLSVRAVFDHVDERVETPVRDQTLVNTWDGGAPWMIEGPTDYTTIRMSARLIANDSATVAQQLDGLRAICGRRADKSPVLACYRDERGRRKFGRVQNLEITDRRLLRADVSFDFVELAYSDVMVAAG